MLAAGATVAATQAHGAGAPSPPPRLLRFSPTLDVLVDPQAKVARVATGFTFLEGPVWRGGRLWLSDLGADRIVAVTPEGVASVLLEAAGGRPRPWPTVNLGPNAMAADHDGSVLLARQGGRTVVRLDRSLRATPFLSGFEGKRFNSPNDLVFRPDGSLWITDPPYGLKGLDADPEKELPFNAVFRYAAGRLVPAITDLTLPNGIAFSPDGRVLYVSNSGPRMCVMAYDVDAAGAVTRGRVLLDLPKGAPGKGVPDGLKVDSLGCIWSTGPGGVRILAPSGEVLGLIALPEAAANLAFGGADRRTLYIAASTSLYRLPLRVAGERPLYAD